MTVGDVILELRDPGTDRERVVVTRADPYTLASQELVDEWYAGTSRVMLERHDDGPDVVRFGTDGEGCGVVAYEIGGEPGVRIWPEQPTVPLRRIA